MKIPTSTTAAPPGQGSDGVTRWLSHYDAIIGVFTNNQYLWVGGENTARARYAAAGPAPTAEKCQKLNINKGIEILKVRYSSKIFIVSRN